MLRAGSSFFSLHLPPLFDLFLQPPLPPRVPRFAFVGAKVRMVLLTTCLFKMLFVCDRFAMTVLSFVIASASAWSASATAAWKLGGPSEKFAIAYPISWAAVCIPCISLCAPEK
eukprot:2724353-Ditylum_brightwellii.AAC.1